MLKAVHRTPVFIGVLDKNGSYRDLVGVEQYPDCHQNGEDIENVNTELLGMMREQTDKVLGKTILDNAKKLKDAQC